MVCGEARQRVSSMPSSAKLRGDAIARGVDPTRWVPTYVDLGNIDGLDRIRMNWSFAAASPTDLLFYDTDHELYRHRGLADPFKYARSMIGRVPIADVTQVSAGAIDAERVVNSRRAGVVKDFGWNKTIGTVFGVSNRSTTIAALVVMQVGAPGAGRKPYVEFGVPHRRTRRLGLGLRGRALT